MNWDWDEFYRNADYDRCVYLAGRDMADLLVRFFERVGTPGTFASVGCGPAVALFDLAERFPGTDFYGFDVSEKVVADNRERAADRENLHFAVDALPDLDADHRYSDRRFDVVYSAATLNFVTEVERALRSLHDRVAPGGHLVVNYPNEALREEAEGFDGRKREAFSLVLEGENLLTEADVERVLDAEVRDYWSAVDADNLREDQWPMVWVEKD